MPGEGLLICVAIQLEADAVRRAIASAKTTKPVEVAVVGIGASLLPTDAEAGKFGWIVSAGLAGALDPTLQHGDVVVDGATTSLPVKWTLAIRSGRIHTSDKVVTTAVEKADLFSRTGALAVDMETAAIRRLAERVNVPFLAIRAISDKADEPIDPAVLGMVDSFGRPRAGAVLTTLIRRPTILRGLLKLRSNSLLAAKRLEESITDLLRHQTPL
jgi:adenosylhomocysteine nucleosidase